MAVTRLDTPQNILVHVDPDTKEVSVTWNAVANAQAYDVEYEATHVDGTVDELDVREGGPSTVIEAADYLQLVLKVRALPGHRRAGGPVQGGGPKSEFSAPITVTIPQP